MNYDLKNSRCISIMSFFKSNLEISSSEDYGTKKQRYSRRSPILSDTNIIMML